MGCLQEADWTSIIFCAAYMADWITIVESGYKLGEVSSGLQMKVRNGASL